MDSGAKSHQHAAQRATQEPRLPANRASPLDRHYMSVADEIKRAPVLVVDDDAGQVALLKRILEVSGFSQVQSTTDPMQTIELLIEREPDLVLLDLSMGPPDGFDLLRMLGPWIGGVPALPVLVQTADVSPVTRNRALSDGATDFLTKPLDPSEVVLRVSNLLHLRLLQRRLADQNQALEQDVARRSRESEEARLETLQRLAMVSELRDDDTRRHPARVGELASRIALMMGVDDETAELLRLAAPLHDIGKLGVTDRVLLKRGELTHDEFELGKFHVSIGAELLSGSRSPVLRLAEEIALTHHERWDGSGYLAGLRGDEIPFSGRVTAVADVFDVLTHRRAYKQPWLVEQAVEEIARCAGSQFDPAVVDAFCKLDHTETASSTAKSTTYAGRQI